MYDDFWDQGEGGIGDRPLGGLCGVSLGECLSGGGVDECGDATGYVFGRGANTEAVELPS